MDARIALGQVAGRIDHLAFDPTRQRLYVAELGNNSVGVVDLKTRQAIRTVAGFEAPQGIAYEPGTDTIYVANAGDGSVRIFRAEDFAPLGKVALDADADNVRVDAVAKRVYVGHGEGALAVIDPATRKPIADIPLKGHPESFQLHPTDDEIFVNVPDAGHIAVVSRKANRQIASWTTGTLRANFPLALDASNARVMSVFRHPARLQAFEMKSGHALNGSDVCGDADDVFFDSRRQRVYAICGEGFVDTFDVANGAYLRVGHLATSRGSRTGLFIPDLDRLVIAIRASGAEPAAIWILAPGQ